MTDRSLKAALPFLHVGLTGGIATGKSTVADLLVAEGAAVIDADLIAREVVRPGQDAYREVVGHFGKGVVATDGTLDRKALGRLVFSDTEARRRLEAILHPRIRARAEDTLRELAARPAEMRPALVVEVIPLLFESGLEARFEEVWVVACPDEVQRARLAGRDALEADEVAARIAAQAPLAEKIRRADRIILNDGDRQDLAARVRAVLDAALSPRRQVN